VEDHLPGYMTFDTASMISDGPAVESRGKEKSGRPAYLRLFTPSSSSLGLSQIIR
jgi:hypothetical protein